MSRTGSSRRSCLLRPKSKWRRRTIIIGGIIIIIPTLVIPTLQVIHGRMRTKTRSTSVLKSKRGTSIPNLQSLLAPTWPRTNPLILSWHSTRSSWSTSSMQLLSRPLSMVWRTWRALNKQINTSKRQLCWSTLTRTATHWLRPSSRSLGSPTRPLNPPWNIASYCSSSSSTTLNLARTETLIHIGSRPITIKLQLTEDYGEERSPKVHDVTSQSLRLSLALSKAH